MNTPSVRFVSPDDPILVTVAKEVFPSELASPELAEDIATMLKAAYGEQRDAAKPLLVGLAAPQIGISRRIILVDVAADGKGRVGDLRLYINPEIVWSSEERAEWYEGCFSTSRVCGIVSRPVSIRVRAITARGVLPVEEEYSGYTARIFQHEIDHLNGREFTSHITNDDHLHWVERDEFPAYRNGEGWRNWPRKCSRARWEEIKGKKCC
ncbi:MAG: peptide deformylase [Candidatus Paceibacterota bacterium]|jgi:peptide deformylase